METNPQTSLLEAVALQLRVYRKTHALTPGQAARNVDVSRSTWFRWESGARPIDESLLPRVAIVTGITPRDLRPDLATILADDAEGEGR